MSFPYSQVSPPPTAGILSVVDRANQNTPYAGGGGGGPIGPNLVVSSLSLPAYIGKTNGSITFAGGMAITDINSSDSIPQYFFDSDKPTANTNYDFVSSFASSITTFNIAQSFAQATSLCLASADNGNAIIFTDSPTSTLALVANPVVIPGNLQVSSINGAAPGGGSVYPLNSTLKAGEATGLGINASSLTTLAAYSTISSHFYTISVDIGPRQLTQTFGSSDGYQTQLTTEGGLVNILNDGLWSQVSTLNNLAITPGLGGSATFKADGSFFTIDIYNNYASTLSTNLNAIFAVDHGPGN